ncbi:MAG: hypothetical protein IJJ41_04315 [Clostridia bacterium]|nr:hypothetical protein [Clostridia bacterium]
MMQRLKAFSKKQKIIAVALVLIIALAIGGWAIYKERSDNFCQYAKPFSFADIQGSEKVTLVAHRGAATDAPENTLPAFEKAAQKGYKYAEADVRATADGIWVLSHDASLKRMTGFRGNVESMTLAEVQAHPIKRGANIKDYSNLKTPTLEQLLALCKKQKLHPVIEIKTKVQDYPEAPFRAIADLLAQFGLSKSAVIISFDYGALENIRNYNKQIRMQYLVKELEAEVFTKADKLGNCGIDCAYQSLLKNPDLVEVAHSAKLPLNAWTADKPEIVEQLCAAGVDFITTNAAY